MKTIFKYKPCWAHRFGPCDFLPMSRREMQQLQWDSCDIILVTGDAYVDHPSFGMAVIGRVLHAQGFRVGIISQPDWQSCDDFQCLGKPNLFFGVTAGNMDSMVNRYTSDRKIRSNDAYTPDGKGSRRPDRASIVYAQRCRQAYPGAPIILGGIEASLRRIAHFDYWSETVRRSILFDAKADMLVFGNAERQIVEIAHRLAAGESIADITDIRGTAFAVKHHHDFSAWRELLPDPATHTGAMGLDVGKQNPYQSNAGCGKSGDPVDARPPEQWQAATTRTVLRLPSFEAVRTSKPQYALASHLMHKETNPGNARALIQAHGERQLWLNPPAIPLTTEELDWVFDLPYARRPHPDYGNSNIPAYEMIRFSVNIMRGCFGGCTFCSITEHEGRIIQNRSQASIVREIENIRDHTPGFTGVVSDLGGPTANMYRMRCESKAIEQKCRRLSCVYPNICSRLNTDHAPLIDLYRRARKIPGIKKVLVASGLRYDLAVTSPDYVKELVQHHVGGYLKIAPEHTETGPLSKMMKPGMDSYHRFKQLFDRFSREAGKEQYLIPYFIAAHPGTTDLDMMHLALWLKQNGFRADQVQTFLPSPMALATAMYHSGLDPLKKNSRRAGEVHIPRGQRARRLHKAFLRYHDPENWPMLRAALKRLGRADLIGNGKKHLIPQWQPQASGSSRERKAGPGSKTSNNKGVFQTRHTHGLNRRRD